MCMEIENPDYGILGQLIEKWAKDPASTPKNLQDFKNQCEDLDYTIELREDITDFEAVPLNPIGEHTVRFVVPHKDDIETTKNCVSQLIAARGNKYPVDDYYDLLYRLPVERQNENTTDQHEQFRLTQLGEYCNKKCG